jgi:hypothetical protein
MEGGIWLQDIRKGIDFLQTILAIHLFTPLRLRCRVCGICFPQIAQIYAEMRHFSPAGLSEEALAKSDRADLRSEFIYFLKI